MRSVTLLVALLAGCKSDQSFQDEFGNQGAPVFSPIAVVTAGTLIKRDVVFQPDGSASYDPDDDKFALVYQWSVTDAPEGADYSLTGEDRPRPQFSARTTGSYTLSLVVTDKDGLPSLNPAELVVEVIPWQDLEVQLFWDTREVDLDLHLIAPGADYYSDHDCYFGNPRPDWGVEGDERDDPMLDQDDEGTGAGELVTLQQPSEGLYKILIHYYSERTSEVLRVTPTVHILAEGQAIQTIEAKRMNTPGQVLLLGTLDWRTLAYNPRDQLTTHAAIGGPAYNE